MYRKALLFGMTLFLTACPRPQEYTAPTLPVPTEWPSDSADGTAAPDAPTAAELPWREFFTNERLRSVIELALEHNRDLRRAALNVERVGAFYRIQRAERYPTVAASADAQLYRLPRKMSPTGQAQTAEQYDVNLGVASWELDLFGRIRSLTSHALEQYLATEQAHAATQLTLVSTVAEAYLAIGADRDNLRLAQATLETQRSSFELIRQTRDFGMASDLELRQAESQVEAAQVEIARYNAQLELDRHALDLLVGTPVPDDLLPAQLGSDDALREIAAGLPSEVLLSRPDVLAAEHQLRALYANIGAARANFFPRITLTAGGGIMSSALSNLFEWGSGTWSFVPQAVLPIFDRGVRKANYRAAELDRDMAVADYEQSIQAAFREVSDSLSLRGRLLEQEQAQRTLVATLGETYRLSEARYKAGIDSYLSVLIAQRTQYAAEQGLINLRFARLRNLVTLYKVLGGGV